MRPSSSFSATLKLVVLLIGDLVVLYASLAVTLLVHSRGLPFAALVGQHLLPFSALFVLWLLVFYVAGLYDLRRLRNNIDFVKMLVLTLVVNIVVGISFFYLLPGFGIAPKTNLLLFSLIFILPAMVWRRIFNRLLGGAAGRTPVLVIGDGETIREVHDRMNAEPQYGYVVAGWMHNADEASPERIEEYVTDKDVELIVVPLGFKHNAEFAKSLYNLLAQGVAIRDAVDIYEELKEKVPLRDIDEAWLLEHITRRRQFYDEMGRGIEVLFALALQVILLPLEIVVALLVALTSRGPVIYRHIRVGRDGKHFMLYKFRSMRADAEKEGVQWTAVNDPRITPVGKLIRRTKIDELPQLWNILKGDLSFVGPRPERPEFESQLEETVPYYRIRHLVKPGLSGWAQINYRYGASHEEAYEKLQYDLYYLKRRSLLVDFAIVLKTLKTVFIPLR